MTAVSLIAWAAIIFAVVGLLMVADWWKQADKSPDEHKIDRLMNQWRDMR